MAEPSKELGWVEATHYLDGRGVFDKAGDGEAGQVLAASNGSGRTAFRSGYWCCRRATLPTHLRSSVEPWMPPKSLPAPAIEARRMGEKNGPKTIENGPNSWNSYKS